MPVNEAHWHAHATALSGIIAARLNQATRSGTFLPTLNALSWAWAAVHNKIIAQKILRKLMRGGRSHPRLYVDLPAQSPTPPPKSPPRSRPSSGELTAGRTRDGPEGAAAKQTTTVCATMQRVMSNPCMWMCVM